jgi:preprotein translocase subunit SecB
MPELPNTEQNNPSISPKEFHRVLRGIELREIFIKKMKSEIYHEHYHDGLTVSFKETSEYRAENGKFVITCELKLEAKNSKKKVAIRIDATYELNFDSQEPINQDFFDIYKRGSLPLNIWPYFRELVHSTTLRMGIPPLLLPLLKE